MQRTNRMPIFLIFLLLVITSVIFYCSTTGTFINTKSIHAPPIQYCNDATGHIPGSKPWILGGTCCCTPSAELMEQYHKDGIALDLTYEDLVRMYREAGITTDLDHKGCNNMCDHGPHVVKGGKCMCTPTPGTKNFEEVVSGVFETVDK
ncbi:MAG: hypothetical protein AMJ73_07055 [candidate division Zixibacteria bacterium SM1_73]|nr:MAG: hypothetical protein AMJ90_10195 [candidate division Zixibacteria bacterium SM23_73_2]KPL03435.1 MAG: hypothetical protein AMJ73_07055 [candidate division Zixibacteria bacterium SM1_73]